MHMFPSRRTAAAVLALAALMPAAVQAQPAAPPATPDPVRGFVERQLPADAGRVEVVVGALDPRLQLAPCARVEPYLLPGTRLWGRTAIGVRCLEGAAWTVALPVTVTIRGRALVAGEPLAAGAVPPAGSLRLEEAELTREPGTPLTDPAQLVGRTLIRPLAAGQVLRAEHFRVTQSVAAGDPVRIQMVGQGFTIQADGQALAGAGEGQSVRVRTEGGRIVAGTLRGRTVEVRI
jgi:flagella basal body P-ring formation protein FlgA